MESPAEPPVVQAVDSAAAPAPAEEPLDTPTLATASPNQRVWAMPKQPVSRKQAAEAGRITRTVVMQIAAFVAAATRYVAGAVKLMWRGFESVPAAGKLFGAAVLSMLAGIVGAVALDNSLGLMCTVVVVPLCAGILGALGHRWYSGFGADSARGVGPGRPVPDDSDLQRSVQYVDRKLTLALTSFGTERHQQAVIALFQAKTAVELTLGTEQDLESYGDITLRADDYGLRPRIRAGGAPTSAPREANSLAAS